jgi:hypothetical protein
LISWSIDKKRNQSKACVFNSIKGVFSELELFDLAARDVAAEQSKVPNFVQERGREEQSEGGHLAHFSKHAF